MRFRRKLAFILIVIIIMVILSFILLNLTVKKISPTIMEYSKAQVKKVATTIINRSINDDVLDDVNLDELFIIDKSSNEEIVNVLIDPSIVNRTLSKVSDAVENSLRRIEAMDKDLMREYKIEEDCFYVPSGIIFNTPLLNNLGPKIPIKLKMIGSVLNGIDTEIKEYGINNSLITLSLEISVELQVILPISSENISITNYVPLVIKLVQGKVPTYFGDSLYYNKKSST